MKKDLIQAIFLYICALIGVIMTSMGAFGLLNITLEKFVFQVEEDYLYNREICETKFVESGKVERSEEEQEECEERHIRQAKNNTRRRVSNDITLLIIGLPLLIFGWRTARKTQGK